MGLYHIMRIIIWILSLCQLPSAELPLSNISHGGIKDGISSRAFDTVIPSIPDQSAKTTPLPTDDHNKHETTKWSSTSSTTTESNIRNILESGPNRSTIPAPKDTNTDNKKHTIGQSYPTKASNGLSTRRNTNMSVPTFTYSTILPVTTRKYFASPCPAQCDDWSIPLPNAIANCRHCLNGKLFQDYLKANQQVTDVLLSHNNITHISGYLCALKRIKRLNLDYNQISSLNDYNFTCFTKLSRLSLAYNKIQAISTHMLDGLRYLYYISLEHNQISYIAKEAFLRPHLQQLQIIKLQHNKLKMIDTWMFSLPAYAKGIRVSVDISHNIINNFINSFNFRLRDIRNNQSITIDVSSNQVQHIRGLLSLFEGFSWHDASELVQGNSRFYIHDNPFDCDCDMYKIVNVFEKYQMMNETTPSKDIHVYCQTPPEAQNKLIYKLPDDVFRCYVNESCPQGAECIHTPGNSTMTVVNVAGYEVNRLPQTVPQETHIQIFYSNTRVETLPELGYLENVTALDLSNSRLSTVTAGAAQQLHNIQYIYFQQCQLTIFPPEMTNTNFTQLKSLDIVGNPFQCDCHMPPMKAWLLEHQSVVEDAVMVQCNNVPFSGKPIIKVPEKLMICGYMYVFLGGSLFMLIIIILAGYAVYRCLKRRIMMSIIKIFDKNFTLRRPSPRTLTYHIVIFVAEEDQYSQKVNDICLRIENAEDNFTVYRLGYVPGLPRLDIAEKLPASEGCLFFMSRHTLQSNHSIFCFRLAVDMFIQNYHSMFFIPILLDSKESLINNSWIPGDTRLFFQLFDSIDITPSTLDLDSVYSEMMQHMKKQVFGFPHELVTTTTSNGEADGENMNDPDRNSPHDISVELSPPSLPIHDSPTIATDTQDNILMTGLPPLDSDSDEDAMDIVK